MKKTIVSILAVPLTAVRLFSAKSKVDSPQALTTRPELQSNLSTRQERRGETIAGRAGRRGRQQAQQTEQVKQGGWWRSFKTIFYYTGAGIGLLSAILGVYIFVTARISVVPVNAIDPKDMFSTPFIIKNDGYLTATNVQVTCIYEKIIDTNNSVWINNKYQGRDSREVGVNRSIAARCPLGKGIAPFKEADMSITLSYQLYPIPRTKTETWSYKVMRSPDGTLNWLPVGGRKT